MIIINKYFESVVTKHSYIIYKSNVPTCVVFLAAAVKRNIST